MLHGELSFEATDHELRDSELPASRELWPAAAVAAYRQVLRELNQWCREHDWPASANHWMAEAAVREAWA